MTYRALSDAVKKQKSRRAQNQRMQEAVEAYKREESKSEELRKSLRVIAKENNVSKSTLSRLVKGGISMSAFNASKQKLSAAEERVIVDFCLESADRGFPLTHKLVMKMANDILTGRLGTGCESVGDGWVDRFLTRHRDDLQTHWSKPLDMQRANALNSANVTHWFNLVKEHIVDQGVKPCNIYGMDESGFPPSDQGTQRVIGRRGTKTQHKQGGGDRENVTALITICADGTVLDPTIIYKGMNFMKKWAEDNPANASSV
jgi:Tc5 transposase DNA-binding domain